MDEQDLIQNLLTENDGDIDMVFIDAVDLQNVDIIDKLYKTYHVKNNNDILESVIMSGNKDIINLAIQNGNNLIISDLFKLAIQYNNLNIVKYLVEEKNAKINDGLITASDYNNLDMVKYFISKGADVKYRLYKAFNFALERSHLKIVKYLLENGIDINILKEQTIKEIIYKAFDKTEIDLIYLITKQIQDINTKRLLNEFVIKIVKVLPKKLPNEIKFKIIKGN